MILLKSLVLSTFSIFLELNSNPWIFKWSNNSGEPQFFTSYVQTGTLDISIYLGKDGENLGFGVMLVH